MNQNIHRINDIIKQVSDLKYDASSGLFETDRRALYDFAVLIVRECIEVIDMTHGSKKLMRPDPYQKIIWAIEEHFGVEE